MKKIYSKTVSTLLAAIVAVSSLSTYAANVKLDFEVESGNDFISANKDSALLMNERAPELDFTVEDGKLENTIPSEDNYAVSLMSDDDDYVLFENGSGTEKDPYIISTPIELLSVAFWVNNGGFTDSYYKLENDIDLEGAEWTPIGEYQKSPNTTYAFNGHFDGNGKTVSNFKISKSKLYAGFFGLVENATVKNLTIADFEITTEYAGTSMYVGGIAGIARAIGEAEDGEPALVIENCHVKNAEITAKSNLRVYGSGHIGYLHSSNNAYISISDCSTDAICNFSVNDANPSSTERSMLRVGGLIGYVGITDAKISISKSYSGARVTANFTDAAATGRNDIHIGGFVGDLALSSNSEATRSKLEIDSCYSTNMVYAAADGDTYAGGFTGYLVSECSDVIVSNCHTTSNVYATSTSNTSYLGGFSSIVGINDTTPIGTIKMQCIYTANNVIDINSNESIAGKLTSYLLGDADFESCFAMADSVIKAKEEIKSSSAPEKLISANDATEFTSYEGFDIDTWLVGSSKYPYPSLAENPFVSGSYSAYIYSAGEISEYKSGYSYGDIPEKPDTTPNSNYIFSHWSIFVGGTDAFDGTKTITSDTVYFPNNSSEYKSYDISFSANGEIFDIKSIKYNEMVEFPVAPPKPADSLFRYAFSHWSKSENGKAVDTSKETVKGAITYYAVYEKVETGVWDGISTSAYAHGNGTVEKPYEISDAYHLAYLKETVNGGTAENGAHYILTKDIDLGGYEWTPIGTSESPFNGTLCGNGYSVYNFNITKPETVTAGLFGYCMNADISKLEVSGFRFNIENPTQKAYVYAAPIAVHLMTSGIDGVSRISECYTDGEITIDAYVAYAGGIAGIAKDTDTSVFTIENCYSVTDITLASDANSTAGGILGKLESEQLGLSYIDKCYYAGNITSNSDVQAYAGGIVGYLQNDEDWADEADLSDDDVSFLADELIVLASVRNSFYAGNKISTTSALTSYGGFTYGYKNDIACVEKCGYIESASITATSVAKDTNIFKISKIADLYDAEYIGEKFGFDFEAVWVVKDKNLPALQIFNQIKNVFRINEYALKSGTLDVELKICYRDVESYLILLGAYDARGKMIGFKSVSVTNPAELRTFEMSIDGMDSAVSCTLSVINHKTMSLIEAPITLTK